MYYVHLALVSGLNREVNLGAEHLHKHTVRHEKKYKLCSSYIQQD